MWRWLFSLFSSPCEPDIAQQSNMFTCITVQFVVHLFHMSTSFLATHLYRICTSWEYKCPQLLIWPHYNLIFVLDSALKITYGLSDTFFRTRTCFKEHWDTRLGWHVCSSAHSFVSICSKLMSNSTKLQPVSYKLSHTPPIRVVGTFTHI